jgi:hypothetical protein
VAVGLGQPQPRRRRMGLENMSFSLATTCAGCGNRIPQRPERLNPYCKRCSLKRRCKQCGRLLSANGDHRCVSTDLRGPRFCRVCSKPLRNTGYERKKHTCPQCLKTQFRTKEREQRRQLKEAFGNACQTCGYSRCMAVLHFHHKDASEKTAWSKKKGSTSLKELYAHPERFQLLCANCHIELHHPQDVNDSA